MEDTHEFISQVNNEYKVHRKIKGKDINFGIFQTLNEAINTRDKLEDNGWPIPIKKEDKIQKIDKNIVEDNIEQKNGEYFVFNYFNKKKKTFGPYETLKDAKIARLNLINNAWETDVHLKTNKYGKYIQKKQNLFYINKHINRENLYFGPYETVEEAINARDDLISKNWGKTKKEYNNSNDTLYILKSNNHYIITKTFNGKPKYFGSYKTLKEAIPARNKLIENNWEGYKPKKSTTNIEKTNRGYEILKHHNGNTVYYGTYPTEEEAILARNLLRESNWDRSILGEEDFYDEFINFDGEFFVIEKMVRHKLKTFGKFNTREEAIEVRDKLIENNWQNETQTKIK